MTGGTSEARLRGGDSGGSSFRRAMRLDVLRSVVERGGANPEAAVGADNVGGAEV